MTKYLPLYLTESDVHVLYEALVNGDWGLSPDHTADLAGALRDLVEVFHAESE